MLAKLLCPHQYPVMTAKSFQGCLPNNVRSSANNWQSSHDRKELKVGNLSKGHAISLHLLGFKHQRLHTHMAISQQIQDDTLHQPVARNCFSILEYTCVHLHQLHYVFLWFCLPKEWQLIPDEICCLVNDEVSPNRAGRNLYHPGSYTLMIGESQCVAFYHPNLICNCHILKMKMRI